MSVRLRRGTTACRLLWGVCGSLCLLAYACTSPSGQGSSVAASPRDAQTATQRVAHALAADQVAWLEAPARVLSAPEAAAVVSTPLAARIERVRVRPGQRVTRGEPVLDVVMPELVQSSAALTAAGLRLEAYQRQRARLEPLVRDGLVLNADLIALDTQISSARAEREAARAVLLSAGMNEQSARELFARTAIVALRAPIAGVVTRVQVRPGETREPLGGPLLEIMGTGETTIEARFTISPDPSSAFEWLGEGGPMPLSLDSVSPVVSEDGARLVWLKPRSQTGLSAGALGRVRVVAPKSWVAIPSSALQLRGGQSFVEVPEGDQRSARRVDVVQRVDGEAIVTGLSVGDAVFQDQTVTAP